MGLFFNHIPKTAGTTTQSVLATCVDNECSFLSGQDYKELFPSLKRPFASIDPAFQNLELICGHLGEKLRQIHFSSYLSLTILREPTSRWKSLLMHNYRDNKAFSTLGSLNNKNLNLLKPDQARNSLMSESMAVYLSPNHEPGRTDQDWINIGQAAKDALMKYDMVLTEEGLRSGLSIIRAVYGHPPLQYLPKLNSKAQFRHMHDGFELPDDFESSIHNFCSEDFELYNTAKELERSFLSKFSANPLQYIYELRGIIDKKKYSFNLDWSTQQRSTGWSSIHFPGIEGLKHIPSRLMHDDNCFLDVPLQRENYNSCEILVWRSDLKTLEFGGPFDLLVDEEKIKFSTFYPNFPDKHLAICRFQLRPSPNRGWTRFWFNYSNRSPSDEFWLIKLTSRMASSLKIQADD